MYWKVFNLFKIIKFKMFNADYYLRIIITIVGVEHFYWIIYISKKKCLNVLPSEKFENSSTDVADFLYEMLVAKFPREREKNSIFADNAAGRLIVIILLFSITISR